MTARKNCALQLPVPFKALGKFPKTTGGTCSLARGDKSGGINLVPRSLVDEAEGEIWPRSGQIRISSPHVVFVRRLGDLVSAKKKRTGGVVCKVLCQKRWELERALDNVFGI